MKIVCNDVGARDAECAAEQYMKSINVGYRLVPYVGARVYRLSFRNLTATCGDDIKTLVGWRLCNLCAACKCAQKQKTK